MTTKNPLLTVTAAEYVGDYTLRLTFSTGEVFGELLYLDKFTQYGLTGYTIEWANGADLAPEFLHDIGKAA